MTRQELLAQIVDLKQTYPGVEIRLSPRLTRGDTPRYRVDIGVHVTAPVHIDAGAERADDLERGIQHLLDMTSGRMRDAMMAELTALRVQEAARARVCPNCLSITADTPGCPVEPVGSSLWERLERS